MSTYITVKDADFRNDSIDFLTTEEKIALVNRQIGSLETFKYVFADFSDQYAVDNELTLIRNTLRSGLLIPPSEVYIPSGRHVAANVTNVPNGYDVIFVPRGCQSVTISTGSSIGHGVAFASMDLTRLYFWGWSANGASRTHDVSAYSANDMFMMIGFGSPTDDSPETLGLSVVVEY